MVARGDVARRHLLYAVSVVCLLLFSDNWLVCTLLMCAIAQALRWHSKSSLLFMTVAALAFPLVEVVLVSTTSRTMRYDYAIPELGIPLWLLPWWAVRAHWVLDIYCACGILHKKNADRDGSSAV
jgi:hypothetical protein